MTTFRYLTLTLLAFDTVMSKKVKHIADLLSHIVVLGTLLFIAVYYPSIPDRIPIHYDANGHCDAMGDKTNLFFVLGIMVGGYFLLGLISKYPHRFTYPFEVKETNKHRVYTSASAMVKVLRLLFMLIFSGVTILTALSIPFASSTFALGILICTAVILIVGGIRLSRANKG